MDLSTQRQSGKATNDMYEKKNSYHFYIYFFLFFIWVPAVAQGDSVSPIIEKGIGESIHHYVKNLVEKGFSGAVIVEFEDKKIMQFGYGWANKEERLPLTPQTVIELASLTKSFTAMAIVKLQKRENYSVRFHR